MVRNLRFVSKINNRKTSSTCSALYTNLQVEQNLRRVKEKYYEERN
jgi:hypothetical protein